MISSSVWRSMQLLVEVRARAVRLVQRPDHRRDLVQDGRGLVEQLAQVDGLGVAAGQPEDVVEPAGDLAPADVLRRVLDDLVLQLRDVDLHGVRRQLADQLLEQRQGLGLEVDLLEVRVHEAVERRDLAVGRLPGHVEHVRRVGQGAALGIGHDPVELAPAGLHGDLVPGQGDGLAVAQDDDGARRHLVGRPGDRARPCGPPCPRARPRTGSCRT